MNTSDRSEQAQPELTVAELESRFEMEALPVVPGAHLGTDWSCTCTFQF